MPEARAVAPLDLVGPHRAGDTIEFSNSEIMGLTVTLASFFHSLFRSVDDFGRRTLGQGAQAPAAE